MRYFLTLFTLSLLSTSAGVTKWLTSPLWALACIALLFCLNAVATAVIDAMNGMVDERETADQEINHFLLSYTFFRASGIVLAATLVAVPLYFFCPEEVLWAWLGYLLICALGFYLSEKYSEGGWLFGLGQLFLLLSAFFLLYCKALAEGLDWLTRRLHRFFPNNIFVAPLNNMSSELVDVD